MKGIVRFFNNTVSWIFAVFCLMLALGVSTSDGLGISSILLLITAIAAAPLRPIKNFWRVVLKSRKILKPVILVITLFVAIGFSTGTDTPSPTPSNTSVSATVETTTATAPSIVELKAQDQTEAATLAPTEVTTEATTEATTEPTIVSTEPEIIPQNSTFSIHFIDVGQADAALIECDGHYMLIDGGNKADSSIIYTVLKNAGVAKLDMVVGTHAHEDHIGGIPGAFNYATADLTLCPVTTYDSEAFRDFKKYADKNGGGITIPSVGNTYSLGSATIKILGVNGSNETNNTSIVLKVTYGKTTFLFTGDAEREAEQVILNSGADLSATVLKVGHHGSDTSTTYPFLREIMPEYAIISVGTGNSYGHPTDNNLSRLRDADVTVYRTDLNGDIYVTSNGEAVTITTEKSASNEAMMTPGGTSQAKQETAPAVTQPTSSTVQETPVAHSYIANKNTKKFHEPSCSSVKQMKESNKWYFTGSRDTLISQGYSPCGKCYP